MWTQAFGVSCTSLSACCAGCRWSPLRRALESDSHFTAFLCLAEQMQSQVASLNTAISFNSSSSAHLNELFLPWPHAGEYWTWLPHDIIRKMQLLQPVYVCVLKLKIGSRRLCVGACLSIISCKLCFGTSANWIVVSFWVWNNRSTVWYAEVEFSKTVCVCFQRQYYNLRKVSLVSCIKRPK